MSTQNVNVGYTFSKRQVQRNQFETYRKRYDNVTCLLGSAIFSFAPKIDNAAIAMLQCLLGNIYPFTMSGPPGELMTREKCFLENDIRIHPLMGM